MTGRKERQYKCPLIKAIAGALPVYKIQTANTMIHKIQPATTLYKIQANTPLREATPSHAAKTPLVDYQNQNEYM